MKALSLWQPWALFVVRGVKQFETRSWDTGYRGTLVIHAAKRWTDEERAYLRGFIQDFNFGWPYTALGSEPTWFGAALGTVELIDVIPTREIRVSRLSRLEFALGNFEHGRYAWKLANPIMFAEPIPCVGHQRLWEMT